MSRAELEKEYGPGKFGDSDWDSTVHFASVHGEDWSLEAVQAAFVFLLLAGLLILAFAVFVLRRHRKDALKPLPLIATSVAAFSMAAAMVNRFALSILSLYAINSTQYYIVTMILAKIFEQVSLCILFFVFYAVIHSFKHRIVKKSTKALPITEYVHWLFIGIFAALIIVDWSWYIFYVDSVVHSEYAFFTRSAIWAKIDSALRIIFWLAAWEIVCWVCYLGIMASRNLCSMRIKMSMYFFIAGSGFFFAINFLFFVWDILSYQRLLNNEGYGSNGETTSGSSLSPTATKGAQAIQEILRFVFALGCFFGLTLCYWRFPEQESSFEDVEAAGINNRIIDRSGMKLREMDGSQTMNSLLGKNKDLPEADDANIVVEADGIDYTKDKAKQDSSIPEVDGSKGIAEADSLLIHETAG